MPILAALVAALGAALIWYYRMRAASEMANELSDVANDIVSAARRFGFRLGNKKHPVDDLDSPDVALAGAGIAFLELGGLPSSEQHSALILALRKGTRLSAEETEEAVILGRWLMTQSGGPAQGFTRLVRKLAKLQPGASFQQLLNVLNAVGQSAGGLSQQQAEAIEEVKVIYRIR